MALYIKACPTVVSISQMLEDEDLPGHFCSPDDPIADCNGRTLPSVVYPFTEGSNPRKARSFGQLSLASIGQRLSQAGASSPSAISHSSDSESSTPDPYTAQGSSDDDRNLHVNSESSPGTSEGAPQSLAEKVLTKEWDRRFEQGLFRYDVRECTTKTTEGVYGFIAQLNEGRATKKRATEFCVSTVCQPYDAAKFNFTKAAMKEVLFQFTAGAVQRTRFVTGAPCGPSPNLVLINVSPIEYGHVLLVPRVNDAIPQAVDQTAMLFALQCAHEVANPFFRLGFNSLGAFGTINHLHFQGYFLEQPYPVERAPTEPIARLPGKVRGVHIERLTGYPVHGWAFSGADNVDSLAGIVGNICMQLQVRDVPHNLLICDSGSRVLLWPQRFAARQARGEVPAHVLETGVNPAAFEIAGHMVLKRREDYASLTEDSAWELLSHVGLSDGDMEALQDAVFANYMVAAPAKTAQGAAACATAPAARVSFAVAAGIAEDDTPEAAVAAAAIVAGSVGTSA